MNLIKENKMNISALSFYKRIIEAKSISKVSKDSFISQSALSQMMQRLESEVGYKLLERSNKGVDVTDMGKIVYKYAKIINRLSNEMGEELSRESENISSLRIDGYYAFVNYALPCVLYKVKKKFPDLNFESFGKASNELLNDLSNELSHMCFINFKPDEKIFEHSFLGKGKIVLVANYDYKIPENITISELVKHEIVFLNSGSIRKDFIIKKLKSVDLKFSDLNIMFEVDNIASAKSSISNGLGMCFLPYMAIKKEIYEKKFKIIEITDFNLDFDVYVVKLKQSFSTAQNSVNKVYNYFVENGADGIC
jgi:DNA-binding transcriptional LysR family regulator